MTSRKLNRTALILAVFTSVGCSGVAAFQQHLYLVAHLVFAGMFFISGVVYINMIAYMESWRDERTVAWKIRRIVALLTILVGASGESLFRQARALSSLAPRHRCGAGHELRAGQGAQSVDFASWRRR